VFENRVLRRMCEPKMEEVAGGCNEELHNLYASPNIIMVIKEEEMGRGSSTHVRK
jgi:hypothetical protein